MRFVLHIIGVFVVMLLFLSHRSGQAKNFGFAIRQAQAITTTPTAQTIKSPPQSAVVPAEEPAIVRRVVDGDTVELESGEKVRYIGVNTPETVDPRKAVQCFGREASEFNKNLVAGKTVHLVRDVSDRDRYGRLLRYVYLEDGTFVNMKLITEGYARPATYPPDVQYSKQFIFNARLAENSGRGLWSACK